MPIFSIINPSVSLGHLVLFFPRIVVGHILSSFLKFLGYAYPLFSSFSWSSFTLYFVILIYSNNNVISYFIHRRRNSKTLKDKLDTKQILSTLLKPYEVHIFVVLTIKYHRVVQGGCLSSFTPWWISSNWPPRLPHRHHPLPTDLHWSHPQRFHPHLHHLRSECLRGSSNNIKEHINYQDKKLPVENASNILSQPKNFQPPSKSHWVININTN